MGLPWQSNRSDCTSSAEDVALIPDQGTEILQTTQHSQQQQQEKDWSHESIISHPKTQS